MSTADTPSTPDAADIAADNGGSSSLGAQDKVGSAKAGDCVAQLISYRVFPDSKDLSYTTYYFCGPYAKQWCRDHPGKQPTGGSCDGVPGWSTKSGPGAVAARLGGVIVAPQRQTPPAAGDTGNSGGNVPTGSSGSGGASTGAGTTGGGNTGNTGGATGGGTTGGGTTGGGTTGGGTTGGGNTGNTGNTGAGTTGGGNTGNTGSTGGGTTGGGNTGNTGGTSGGAP